MVVNWILYRFISELQSDTLRDSPDGLPECNVAQGARTKRTRQPTGIYSRSYTRVIGKPIDIVDVNKIIICACAENRRSSTSGHC